jgi:DNA-binding transcriptional regulator LsrR (DeoR family)
MNTAAVAPSSELRQMVRCLEMYYREQRSQKEIAKALGVSAATVSRLVKRAFAQRLVRVELDLPRTPRLEGALSQRFGLRDAVVVAGGGRGDLREDLGRAAAAYFEAVARHGIRVGVSCGFTLYETIRHLHDGRFRKLVLYPLSGESTLRLVDLFPNTLVGMMAAKYRPHVTAFALPIQHLASITEIDRLRRRLLRDPEIRRIYEAAQNVHIALVGIGMIAEQTPGFCSLAESYDVSVKRLRQLGVVGEINYQPFNAEGKIVDEPELRALLRRILSVGADRLQALSRRRDRYVIAIAGGQGKIDAIRGALRGRFMNVLVTDEDVASALLSEEMSTPPTDASAHPSDASRKPGLRQQSWRSHAVLQRARSSSNAPMRRNFS